MFRGKNSVHDSPHPGLVAETENVQDSIGWARESFSSDSILLEGNNYNNIFFFTHYKFEYYNIFNLFNIGSMSYMR